MIGAAERSYSATMRIRIAFTIGRKPQTCIIVLLVVAVVFVFCVARINAKNVFLFP